jgi:hypothetical protein
LNYNHRKPYIPLPPALPRFSFPDEASANAGPSDRGGDDVDPLDAAATAQRPAVSARTRGSRRVVRRTPAADSTEEVQLEDILLEAYAEDPPPPPSPRVPPLPARVSIAASIASAVPPPPEQSAAVDALLRASDPAFAPFVPHSPHGSPHAHYAPQGQGYIPVQRSGSMPSMHGPDYETPSVSPMMLATTAPPARPVIPARRTNRALAVTVWTLVLLVVGVAACAAVVLGVRNGTYARLRESAKSAAARAGTKHDAPVAASPAAPASPIAPAAAPLVPLGPRELAATPVAPAAAAAPAVPTMSVDALPKSPIPADSSLVTLPAYAQGHRVFVDGRVIAVADGSPTKIKCGRHMIKIGSARKPRVIDLACGREVVIQ